MVETQNTRTKEIKIIWDGKEDVATIKKMGWAEKHIFMDQFIETTVRGITPELKIKVFEMKIRGIQKCVVKAPFKTTDEALNEIEDIDNQKQLDLIYKEIELYNNLNPDQKKN
jgi:hypothetical protein